MRKKLLYLFLISVCALHLFAQNRQEVFGKVTDEKGLPISGASIVDKKSKKGVSTTPDGNFTIAVLPGGTLVVSFVGYEKKEIVVGREKELSVSLKPLSQALNEVVVTALGRSVSKAKTGYSTATFNSAEINKNAAVAALDGLEGKVAGAEISDIGGPEPLPKLYLEVME